MNRPAKGHRKARKGVSRAQQQYLSRMYAAKAEEAKENCHCAGCIMCKGNVPGCVCDLDSSTLYLRAAQQPQPPTTPVDPDIIPF